MISEHWNRTSCGAVVSNPFILKRNYWKILTSNTILRNSLRLVLVKRCQKIQKKHNFTSYVFFSRLSILNMNSAQAWIFLYVSHYLSPIICLPLSVSLYLSPIICLPLSVSLYKQICFASKYTNENRLFHYVIWINNHMIVATSVIIGDYSLACVRVGSA